MVCYGGKATKGGYSTLFLREIVLRESQAHFQSEPSSGPLTEAAVNNISLSFSKLWEAYKPNTLFVVCSCALSSVLSSLIILIKV